MNIEMFYREVNGLIIHQKQNIFYFKNCYDFSGVNVCNQYEKVIRFL